MELYVLRHAIAVQRGTEGYEQDSDRPLTSKGRQKMERIASAMQTLGLSFDLILSSPFLRARQTADVVADVFGTGKNVELSEHLAVGGDPESLVRELNSRFDSLKSVLIVGHEPYLSSLISVLLAGDTSLDLTMKKGGLCKLSVDSLSYGSCATLEWLLTPRQLRRIS